MSEELWDAFDVRDWQTIPHMSGRVAIEEDVISGRAVFYLQNPDELGARPHELTLPHCGILNDEDTGEALPVVLIQVEEADDKIYVGYRSPSGGNGLCFLPEIDLLDRPDYRFGAEK